MTQVRVVVGARELEKLADEAGPHAGGELDGGDGGDDLARDVARAAVGCGQGGERVVLDAVARRRVEVLPAGGVVVLAGGVAGREGVLDGEAGGVADVGRCLVTGERLAEVGEVGGRVG